MWNATQQAPGCTIDFELVLHSIPDVIPCLAILQLLQGLDLARVAHVLLQRLLRPLWQCLQPAHPMGQHMEAQDGEISAVTR